MCNSDLRVQGHTPLQLALEADHGTCESLLHLWGAYTLPTQLPADTTHNVSLTLEVIETHAQQCVCKCLCVLSKLLAAEMLTTADHC